MTNSHQVLFVRRNITNETVPTITHIGGRLSEGAEWTIPTAEAINGIQSGRFEFYIQNDQDQVERIVVGKHRRLGTYLKSEHDKGYPERLLQLPGGLSD